MRQLNTVDVKELNKRDKVKRVLLTDKQAKQVSILLCKLRDNSCRVDTSKVVNEILNLFFKKYEVSDFQFLKEQFFDKKSYLKQLINNASSDDIDESIKQYLSQAGAVKRRGRKSKSSMTQQINEKAASS